MIIKAMKDVFSIKEAKQKIEHFCGYQERCHEEVVSKLRTMKMDSDEIDQIMVHLITENFLNEERFACSFARGKHRIKHWGKIRIVNELKYKNISQTLINNALKEITPEEYSETFHTLAERNWEAIQEKNVLKKRKKFCDFMLRKGFESNLVYDKVKEFESSDQ
jgi:regulatory protein